MPSRTSTAALAVLLAVVLSASALAEEPFAFRFDPTRGQDRVEITQRLHLTRTREVGELGRQSDEATAEARIVVLRTPQGYTMTVTPLSTKVTRDGQEVTGPLATLQSLEVVYRLDREGKLVEVEGLGKAVGRVLAALPPERARAIAELVDPEALAAREKAEWDSRYGDLLGKTVRVGDVWRDRASYEVPGGPTIAYAVKTSVPRALPCAAGTCLAIETTSWSDAPAAGRRTARTAGAPEVAEAAAETPQDEATIEGRAGRIIDPTTMRLFREQLERTIVATVDLPGHGPTRVRTFETRSISYSYQ